MAAILIVEDDSTFAHIIEGFLIKNNYEVTCVSQVTHALKCLENQSFQLILIDYRLPDGTGIDLLHYLREKDLRIPAIMMTSFNDVRTAVKSIQLGASDYITKPINPDELLMILNEVLQVKKTPRRVETSFIRGKSEAANKLYQHIDLVANTDMSVIIQGESGTGKEFVARTLHLQSKRKNNPFIAIDCGALSKDLAASELFGHVKGAFTGAIQDKKGSFEEANGGTLFLDEIGNLNYEVQIKLLRALQERLIHPLGSAKQIPVDVRIITATNDELMNSIRNGEFREDLYYRLNEFKIRLPALRERGPDLELFIEHFTHLANRELNREVTEIDEEVRSIFFKYDWPGNLRELRNVIKRMVLLTQGGVAKAESLPDEMRFSSYPGKPSPENPSDLKASNQSNEKALIIEALVKAKHNKSKAARLLNIDRKTLYAKMERYHLE